MCYLIKWSQETGTPLTIRGKPSFSTKCRKCLECRQERAREWGLRNMLEADEHQLGCFITLTYSDEHNPTVLVRKDLQDFKKRLRDHLKYHFNGLKIKTFDCGEYGTLNYRPHFHMLIHGFDFPDKYVERQSDKGHNIYNSPTLEKLWGKGLVTVQDLTLNSAAYCALYAAKPPQFLPEHLQAHPEFNTMSKSLGMRKIMENMETYLLTDEIFYDGKKYRIPETALNKYFASTKLLKKHGLPTGTYGEVLKAVKDRRRERGEEIWNARKKQLGGTEGDWERAAVESYDQARYRAENREKRLTKPL